MRETMRMAVDRQMRRAERAEAEVARLREGLERIAECVPVFYLVRDEWRQIEPDQSEEFEAIDIRKILEPK